MRVITGALGGRTFAAPNSHRTHPMSDKIRGALFNVLGDISGLSLLDAFSGSGAIAIEAVSRGARPVLAIEADTIAQRTIATNFSALAIDGRTKLVKATCGAWSDTNQGELFDIVVADPPYDRLQRQVLGKLARHVKPGGIYALSWPGSMETPAFDGFQTVGRKGYGDAQLLFLRRNA